MSVNESGFLLACETLIHCPRALHSALPSLTHAVTAVEIVSLKARQHLFLSVVRGQPVLVLVVDLGASTAQQLSMFTRISNMYHMYDIIMISHYSTM